MERTDAELVKAATQGDLASFGQHYERHYCLAVGMARARLSGRQLAIDDPKQMVCWFTQKGSTRPRAVFAELKVKEVSPSELPFDLKK